MRKVKQEMADEKEKKQKSAAPAQGGGKPQGKKAKPAQEEAGGEQPSGKPARPKANNRATARMREKYYKEVLPALMKEFSLENTMAAPKLEKIVVNMGVGEATQNAKLIDPAVSEMTQITGQKPIVTKAQEVDRAVQGARRKSHRRDGDPARRPHVRVFRPAGEHCAAARA